MSTVTPGTAASSLCASSSRSRCRTSSPRPSWRRTAAVSSVVTMILATPSALSSATSWARVRSPIGCLAAGHRHGGVAQQLVGDVDAGGDGRPDGETAGVGEGAVADVLDEVLLRRRTAPCRSSGRPRRPSG